MPQYRFLLALCLRESEPNRQPGARMANAEPDVTPESLLAELADEFPSVPEYQHELAVTWSRVNTHQLDEASLEPVMMEEWLTRARDQARSLYDHHPTVPAYASNLIHIYGKLSHVQTQIADVFVDRSDRDEVIIESERNLRAAIALQESLIRRSGDVLAWRLWLARFERRLGDMLMRQARGKEARTVFDKAVDRLKDFIDSIPDVEVSEASLRILASLFEGLENACKSVNDTDGAIDARIGAEFNRARLQESRRGNRPPSF